MFMIAV